MIFSRSRAKSVIAPELAICGAHRASGTTTLSVLLHPARDLGLAQDAVNQMARVRHRPLILTCRSSAWAAPRALAAAEILIEAGAVPDVLVVIHDPWPMSPEAAARFRQASNLVGTVVTLPFLRQLQKRPDNARLPGTMRDTLADIRMLATGGSERHPVTVSFPGAVAS